MKIRTGFVSNSSSSSFVALFPADKFEEMKAELSPVELATVEEVGFDKKTFNGIECVVFGYTSGNYSTVEYLDRKSISARAAEIAKERGVELSEDEDSEEVICEATYSLQTLIRKLPKDTVFTHSEDF